MCFAHIHTVKVHQIQGLRAIQDRVVVNKILMLNKLHDINGRENGKIIRIRKKDWPFTIFI